MLSAYLVEGAHMGDEPTRWTVNVASRTDIDLRTYLAQRGMKKGDLSKFIEDAVKWRLFDLTVQEARAAFADLEPGELEDLIGEAVLAARGA
jgi:Ribbon-helix-helix domain